MRKSGIEEIGDVPWGTHLCQLYSTTDQLLHAVAGYFKAGLESHEYCMWITSPPVGEAEALHALQGVLPNARDYLATGQLALLPHGTWYLAAGRFAAEHIHQGWLARLEWALQRGYEGLRVSGNPTWLETKEDWKRFHEYERLLSVSIGKRALLALCAYPVDQCSEQDVTDILRHHQVVIGLPVRTRLRTTKTFTPGHCAAGFRPTAEEPT